MAAKKIILCDTNIFIELFHENDRIIQELDYLGFDRLAISVIAAGEIYYGMANFLGFVLATIVHRAASV